ncbi:MAG TPA: hypothetical protein VMX75_13140 [Spirochaetia bacterium]|nr:hypothetical protein [Spirochaetia bacterium]
MVLSNLARLFYDEEFSGEVLEEPSNSRIEERLSILLKETFNHSMIG